jgi:capsular polysaccharide transport system permease protein
VAPSNPQVATLQAQAARLRASIADASARVVGQGSNSLSAKFPAFSRLVLEKDIADRQLGASIASLEAARSEAARKQLYLERLVQPNLPDVAIEPRRLKSVFTVLVLGLVAWGVFSLLLAGVREHAD